MRQQVRAYRWYQRELERTRERVAIGAGQLDDRIRFLQQATGPLDDTYAGGRQRNTLWLTLHERHAQVFLELADLRRQRRLADARALGRATEMPLVRERDQIAEIPQVHGHMIDDTYQKYQFYPLD